MRITTHAIRTWADDHAIPDLMLAELDYRLTHALSAIYGDLFLAERLYLKGGTALNKLFFPTVNRLSVDLDFNVVGPKAQVLAERREIASRVMALLSDQDAGYGLAHDYRYEQSTIHTNFVPLSGGPRQHMKLELSFIERVPILGREDRSLALPGGEAAAISTYRLEELTATKLRALYGRRKGRDIFDLWQIGACDLDERATRKLALYYFYHARIVFHYPTFRANVEEKLHYRGFADDVRGLIRVGQQFDWMAASRAVLERFSFLGDLDERDHRFLNLARSLLEKPVPAADVDALARIEHPIAWLMEGMPISPEAAALQQDDIRVFIAV